MKATITRKFHTRSLNLALAILRSHLPLNEKPRGGTPAVRLALHMLYRHISVRPALLSYWGDATSEIPHPWLSGHRPYAAIVSMLQREGWAIDPANLP